MKGKLKRQSKDLRLHYTLTFHDSKAVLETVGGKGASLAKLTRAGLPVPEGFNITTGAYHCFVSEHGLQAVIIRALENADQDRLASLEEAARCIQEQFLVAQLPAEVAAAILEAYAALPGDNPAVAVRSSATAEDLPQASFAGQQESYLNISSSDRLLEATRKCWASLWTARAIGYRLRQGISPNGVAQAVVVQLLVPADAAGILFTANAVTGRRSEAVISASWGLGEAVVGGLVTPDAITVDKKTRRVLERITADKQVMTVRAAAGTEQCPVPDHLRRIPVLGDSEAAELVSVAVTVEQLFDTPVDIEWARYGGHFAILQARPITALPDNFSWNDSLLGDYLWTNVNFGEAISEVMTPLTCSVIHTTLEEWVFIPGVPMVGNIGGRPYLNFTVMASLFQAAGKSRRDLLEEVEATLYMNLPETMEIPTLCLTGWRRLAALCRALWVRAKQGSGARKSAAYLRTNPEWFRQTVRQIRSEENMSRLAKLWQEEIRPHIQQGAWCVLGSAVRSSGYTMQLHRDLAALVGPDDAGALIANLSDSSGALLSVGPVLALSKVAHGEMSRATYLEQYGHRGPQEFELSLPHPGEDPAWFDRQLANYLQAPIDVEVLLHRQRSAFDAARERLQSRYPRRARLLHARILESGRRARLREAVRSEYVRDRWAVRLFALRAGELSGLGDDIFFLTVQGVLGLLAGDKTVTGAIPGRRKSYAQYQSLPVYPSVIRGSFDPFIWAANPQVYGDVFGTQAPEPSPIPGRPATMVITGSPGSAGQVVGIVRCLKNAEEGERLQPGEILVAVQTDIAWTLLFPRAAAVVTDVGAPLSHAAIVARELGIPAVVGCGNATQLLKTGDRVRVDGGRGVVELLEMQGRATRP